MQADLFSANVDFRDDLVRNIPGIRESQHLFDDLSPAPADWDIAIVAEGAQGIPTPAALITRPFDYGSVISYTFDSSHWQTTRFSNGSLYGVWYGALAVETTVYETAWHWYRFVLDSFAGSGTTILAAERVGRLAYTLEIEPKFVDVAIKRWQAFSRKDAIHAETGLSFDETANERCTAPEAAPAAAS